MKKTEENMHSFHEKECAKGNPALGIELKPIIPVKKGAKFPPLLNDWPKLTPRALEEALAKYPGCNRALRLDHFLVLDPDNEAAVRYLDSLEKEGKLPPTVIIETWRKHPNRIYRRFPGIGPFTINAEGMKLEIRTGEGQYIMLPPSIFKGLQYTYQRDLSPADVEIAELPIETLRELEGKYNKPRLRLNRVEPAAISQVPQVDNLGIPTWAKDYITTGDVGSYASRSERDHAVIGALKRAGCSLDTVTTIFASFPIGEKYREKGQHGRAYLEKSFSKAEDGDGGCENPASPIIWPEWVMDGAAGKFARSYADYLETPASFLYMSYLTLLGHIISERFTLQSEINPQPRLFTVLLGDLPPKN